MQKLNSYVMRSIHSRIHDEQKAGMSVKIHRNPINPTLTASVAVIIIKNYLVLQNYGIQEYYQPIWQLTTNVR